MELWQVHQKLSRQLSPMAKLRIRQMVPRYLERAKFFHDPKSLYLEALTQLKPQFPSASPSHADVLASYLIGVAAVSQGSSPVSKGSLQPMNPSSPSDELSEMESLRLQMAMDRMSKMMSTLSNLLKKVSETNQSITQNIK